MTITAVTGDGEISNIVVPNGTPGYVISAADAEARLAASDTRELSFQGARVPEGNLLGPRGQGFTQFLQILDGGRISVAAMGVGLAQGCYDLAYAYAKEREQFGKPISKFQAVQEKLVDMATEIEAARYLVWKAAWEKDQGRDFAPHGRDGEALLRRAVAPRSELGARRSTAATVSWTSTRSRASTATRRSWRSERARMKFSAWSSLGISVCSALVLAAPAAAHLSVDPSRIHTGAARRTSPSRSRTRTTRSASTT